MTAVSGTQASASGTPPEAPKTWSPTRRSKLQLAVITCLALVAALAIAKAWSLPPFSGSIEETEDAYVRGQTVVIAPQVSGYVVAVEVQDYEEVQAGQVLARIDDRIYRARVAQASADLAAQVAALENNTQAHAASVANVEAQSAAVRNAEAQLAKARADMARADDLVKDGAISIRERDQTVAALRQAETQLSQAVASTRIAREQVKTVEVGRGGNSAQVDGARARLQAAEIDLSNTVIRAPQAGQLGEIGVRLGQYVTNGTQLVSLVPPDRWVTANYKETQTRHFAVGQRARVSVDALGGATLNGHVERLAPATGSEFSVLKPDNASGNFIKIPQRISVRLAIDPGQPLSSKLRPGMSVRARLETQADSR